MEANNYLLDDLSPLQCPWCKADMVQPRTYSNCSHSLCQKCSISTEAPNTCPLCKKRSDKPPYEDAVLSYIIESSKDKTDICGNCDSVNAPMYFCETCYLPLCNLCRMVTHQAKIFCKHVIVLLEERGSVKGEVCCKRHGEAYILYNLDTLNLLCIGCFNETPQDQRNQLVNIDTAHNICIDKVSQASQLIKHLQEELKEHIDMRKRVLLELNENLKTSTKSVNLEFEKIIETINEKRELILDQLQNEKTVKEEAIKRQITNLVLIQFPIRQNLLSASMFCSYVSKIDFLRLYEQIKNKFQKTSAYEIEKLDFTGDLSTDTSIKLAGLCNDTSIHSQPPDPEMDFPILAPSSNTPLHTQMINCSPTDSVELLQKIEFPLRAFSIESANISQKLQEAQCDITKRRCLISSDQVNLLIEGCENLKSKIDNHLSLIQDHQSILRQIWQTRLDNVRREQSTFRCKLDTCLSLADYIRNICVTSQKLRPFLSYLTSVVYTVNEKRVRRAEVAPMERICMEICTIEPDSKVRCEAIEKEEETRRHAHQLKMDEEKNDIINATVKHLKPGKEVRRKSRKNTLNHLSDHSPILISDDRDRNSFLTSFSKMKASNVSSCESMNSLMDEMDIYRTVSPTMSQLSIPTSPHSGMVSIVEQEMMASAGNPLEEKETTIVRDSEITKDDVKSFAEPQLKERDSHIVLEPIPNPPENIQLFDKKSLIPKIVFQGTTNQEIISDQKVMKNKLLADLIEKVPKIPAVDEI